MYRSLNAFHTQIIRTAVPLLLPPRPSVVSEPAAAITRGCWVTASSVTACQTGLMRRLSTPGAAAACLLLLLLLAPVAVCPLQSALAACAAAVAAAPGFCCCLLLPAAALRCFQRPAAFVPLSGTGGACRREAGSNGSGWRSIAAPWGCVTHKVPSLASEVPHDAHEGQSRLRPSHASHVCPQQDAIADSQLLCRGLVINLELLLLQGTNEWPLRCCYKRPAVKLLPGGAAS